MLTLLFASIFFYTLAWLARKRPAAAIAGAFLLFTFATRTLSLIYVDLAGPVYADELSDFVGGGQSMPLFACSLLALAIPLGYAFRPSSMRLSLMPAVQHIPRRRLRRTATSVFVALLVFWVALYAEMLARGPIPLFAGIDRLQYNQDFAGVLHPFVFDFGFLFAAALGCMFVRPRLHGSDFDFRFFGLYVAMLAYYALTGNRFSAFYSFTSFFVLPLAALPALEAAGRLPAPPVRRNPWKRFLCSRSALLLGVAAAALGIVLLLLNSVLNVRAYDDPADLFFQRVLVQPVELWWTTWAGLEQRFGGSFADAWDALFVNPIDPTRNTSIQMLMIKNLGDQRAAELLDLGQQYTGGYPEVLFELLGPWFALPVALAFSVVTVSLLRLIVVSVCLDRPLTAAMGLYVFYGFSLLYIGGMLNFLLVWTFWAKCLLLVLVYLAERRLSAARAPRTRIRTEPRVA